MKQFIINANQQYLTQDIQAFYHADFHGATHPDNPNFLYKLKNDIHHNWTNLQIQNACNELRNILMIDLPKIRQQLQINSLTVCVVPRSKVDNSYNANQLLFKATVKNVVIQLNNGFVDGTNYIVRHTNTKTTHLRNPIEGFVNEGRSPYPGITRQTCHISNNVAGKNILLVDDIYTKTVNIDEDAIEALLSCGANSVAFYAIGNTVFKY